MEDEMIKEALSYSLGSDMHEVWRNSRKKEDGTYEPKMKKTKDEEMEQMGSHIHEEWLKRNKWVYDPNYGNYSLTLPYEKLSKEEQDKDKAQIYPAIKKVKNYMNGLVDIDSICEKYGLDGSKTL